MPNFAVFESPVFFLFSDFLGTNFEGPEPGFFSDTTFYYSGPFLGSNTVTVEGVDIVADEDGNIVSGQVTGIRWDSYAYFVIQLSGIFDLNLDAVQVAQALEDSWTLTGPDRYDGVAAFFAGQELTLDYSFYAPGVIMDRSIALLMPDDTQARILGTGYGDIFYGFAGGNVMLGYGGNDTMFGGNAVDTFFGGEGDDSIIAYGGDDVIYGDAGRDNIQGNIGDDTIRGGDGDDTLAGNTQQDRLFGDAGDDLISGDAGFDSLYGGDGNDSLDGGAQADNLFGDAGDDNLDGGAGFDRLFGGDGNDTLDGGDGSDGMFGQFGNDLMHGGTGDDRLFGGLGNDILEGGADDDMLLGGAGFDRIVGGAGNDMLSGNFNADAFVFAEGFGQDTITDFDALNQLERIDFSLVASITDLADLVANHLVQDGANTVIDAGDGNTITLLGVNVGDLDATDFTF